MTPKSVRAGWKTKSYVLELSATFAVCPYDITHWGGNHRTPQSQSCLSTLAYQCQTFVEHMHLRSWALQSLSPLFPLWSRMLEYSCVVWNTAFFLLSFFFLMASFLPSIFISPLTHTDTHAQGPLGTPSFHSCFSLSVHVGILWGRVKPLNYCTLKCILTLLRDHVDGEAFHCCSKDLKWWTTKEHDLLIIFNCRIKMIMKLGRIHKRQRPHHKVTLYFWRKTNFSFRAEIWT